MCKRECCSLSMLTVRSMSLKLFATLLLLLCCSRCLLFSGSQGAFALGLTRANCCTVLVVSRFGGPYRSIAVSLRRGDASAGDGSESERTQQAPRTLARISLRLRSHQKTSLLFYGLVRLQNALAVRCTQFIPHAVPAQVLRVTSLKSLRESFSFLLLPLPLPGQTLCVTPPSPSSPWPALQLSPLPSPKS